MYNRRLEKDRQNLINEAKKLDLPTLAKKDIIKALKRMDMCRMLRKHQQDGDMDFQIFDYLKKNCYIAFVDMDPEDIEICLRELVYNAIHELEEI